MQKHQWRQHGIVHFKSRPNNCANGNSGGNSNNPQVLGIIGAEGVLYSSLIDRLKEDGSSPDSDLAASTSLLFDSESSRSQLTEHEEVYDADLGLAAGHRGGLPHDKESPTDDFQTLGAGDQDMVTTETILLVNTPADVLPAAEMTIDINTNMLEQEVRHTDSFFISEEEGEGYVSLDLREETVGTTEQYIEEPEEVIKEDVEDINHQAEEEEEEETNPAVLHQRPMKLKQQLAQAYMREVKESREREERGNREREGRDSWPSGHQLQMLKGMDQSLSEFRLTSSGESNSSNSSPANSRPESRVVVPGFHQLAQPLDTPTSADTRQAPPAIPVAADELSDAVVEVLCKSCGKSCLVTDPYSFCCGSCGVRYTSLPTHMIADPLQCIGCLEIFMHKPGLKAHQQSAAAAGGRERPFRCCRCGFEFRQKAHLQKHQWRIHRKKLEPEAAAAVMRQAEIMLQAATHPSSEGSVTIKKETYDIVIEPAGYPNNSASKPLDLSPNSPSKMYGTTGSINKWVKQVETARTPLVPDISILKKEPAVSGSAVKMELPAATSSMPRFKELLSRQPLTTSLSALSKVVASSLVENSHSDLRTPSPSSVTVRRIETTAWPPAPLVVPQHQQPLFAVKSRPPVVVLEVSSSQNSFHRDDNPLLNQVTVEAATTIPSPAPPTVVLIPSRASKRPRTEAETMATSELTIQKTALQAPPNQQLRPSIRYGDNHPGAEDLNQVPADLSLRSRPVTTAEQITATHHRLHGPLSLNTGTFPLRLETAYSTVSPPLNLSSSSSFASSPQTTAFDYTLGGGKGRLLQGQLQRLKNQDQRSGI